MRGFAIRESNGVRLVTPYDKQFVESLKLSIPHHYREYDPDSRSWLVSARMTLMGSALPAVTSMRSRKSTP
jgi:hypothetical protein